MFIFGLIIGLIVGAITAILVYHNNQVKFNEYIDDTEDELEEAESKIKELEQKLEDLLIPKS